MVFIYLISGLFLGWTLGANDTGNIFGAAVETRMLRFRQAALIAAIFISLGAILEGSGPSQTLGRLGSVDALGGAFTVALSAAAAITVMVRIRIPVSTSQTIVGAIIGWNFFSGRLTDFASLLTIASSWVTAFLLSGGISALLFHIFRRALNRSKMHLLEQDYYTRIALVLVGAFAAYSLGANNIANVVGVFVPVSPFRDLSLGGLYTLDGVQQLYIIGAVSIVVGIYTYSHKVMRTVGRDLLHLSPITALIVLLAQAIVLFLFASRGLHEAFLKLGIPPIPLVPVSSTQVVVGAVVGIGLVKGGKNLKLNILGRISMGWILAPLMAFFFSFIALFIIQNVFEQEVMQNLKYSFNSTTVREIRAQNLSEGALALVNGRTFHSQQEIYNELSSSHSFTKPEILKIIDIVEVYPLKIDSSLLYKRGLHKRFSTEQLESLKSLEERSFKHKWSLKKTLWGKPGWDFREKPHTELEALHNQKLDAALDLLFRSFYHPEQ